MLPKQKDILRLFYSDYILTDKILFTRRKKKVNLSNFKLLSNNNLQGIFR